MRVLFSIIPGHGHFFPMLPMARALRDAGHGVVFASSASYGETIRSHGFEAIAVGPDFTQTTAKGEGTGPDVEGPLIQLMFIDGPPIVARDLLVHFEHDRPDVILADVTDVGCVVAASVAGVPVGCVLHGPVEGTLPLGFAPIDPGEREQFMDERFAGRWKRLHEEHGVEPPALWPGERLWMQTLTLVQAPPSLNPWSYRTASHTAHPLRPEIHTSEADSTWRDDLPEGPIVGVSLGTLFGTRELNEVAARGIIAAGGTPVLATPFDVDVDGARTVDWVSMDHLMEASDAFVHHGGWGVTTAGIVSGTPMVVLPQGADQFDNAERLDICGAGVPVLPDDFSEEAVAAAVTKALTDPFVGLAAKRLADEVAAMPSAAECTPLIERLAETGGPVLNR